MQEVNEIAFANIDHIFCVIKFRLRKVSVPYTHFACCAWGNLIYFMLLKLYANISLVALKNLIIYHNFVLA